MKKILLLGASGSIGLQTIDVVCQHASKFEITGLSVGSNIQQLYEILKIIQPKYVCIKNFDTVEELVSLYPNITFYSGDNGLLSLVNDCDYDVMVNALMGFVGLVPTLRAIELNKDVALANKETLVAGGIIVKEALNKSKSKLLPIDSEHSAILQCLNGNEHKNVNKIIITASGGSFRDRTREELVNVTIDDALSHPNWSMGAKITIDSATMMNKGLEVIEAHWLFDLPYEKIETIMHKESIIHSMVEFEDTSIVAQLGTPDMRLPIQYALTYPNRLTLQSEYLDFKTLSKLHFEELSTERFPFLKLAYDVGKKSGNLPAVMNGANEAAVKLFLNKEIGFIQIEDLVFKTVNEATFIQKPTLDDIIESDKKAREYVCALVKGV